ncbi:putative papain-like cysteine peptidase superfamily [Helianthus anomalus]
MISRTEHNFLKLPCLSNFVENNVHVSYFQSHDVDQTFKGYFTVAIEPFPPIHIVDEVYVPLYIQGVHWVLGVFNLVDYTLMIYDIHSPDLIDCSDRPLPLPLHYTFYVIFASDAPQQSGALGDFGVWVCIYLERLINKKPLNDAEDTETTAYRMRRQLALLFYDSLLPDTTSDNVIDDEAVFVR